MSSAPMRPSNANKLLGLEAIRFVCALAVLFWHYQHFSFFGDQSIDFARDRQPLYGAFSFIYDYGYFGVTIFWCISGFIFFWKYKEAICGGSVGYRKFFILRFSRLYPLHFATLLLVALLQIAYFRMNDIYFVFQKNDFWHFLLQLLFASNWASVTHEGDSFNGPIWSISVEVLVYCFFYLVLRHVGKSALINIAILAACLIAKFNKVPTPVVDCLAFFYAGGLAAMALQHFDKTGYRSAVRALAIFMVCVVPALVMATGIYRNPHFSFLFLISYTPVLLYVCAQNFAIHPVIQRSVEAAGNMTYSSYLIHFPIQLAVALAFAQAHRPIPYESLPFFGGFFFVTLLASYCIYRFFEMPAQTRIRNRFK